MVLALASELALPHPVGDLERLLEHLEADAELRKREAETARLVLVPGGTDAEPGPAARQDVERRGGLHPQGRVPVVDAADHQAEAGAFRVRGHETERGPAFEHRFLDGADAADLEEVVHHPDRIEADVVGVADDLGERRADRGRAPGERVRIDLEAELHFVAERSSYPGSGLGWPRLRPRRPRI